MAVGRATPMQILIYTVVILTIVYGMYLEIPVQLDIGEHLNFNYETIKVKYKLNALNMVDIFVQILLVMEQILLDQITSRVRAIPQDIQQPN